jgi:hypothetical protein
VGDVAYEHAEVGSADDDGYFARAGVRFRPIGLFEAGGFARYQDVGDEDDVVWQVNALIYVWRLGLGAEWESQDDVDSYNVFARFNFGLRN